MSYGIRVVNSSGFVQIDPDYSNYAVLVQGAASGSGTVHVDFPAQSKPPLVFAKFAATDRWLALTQLTNSRATFFIYPNAGYNTGVSGSFSYAICTPFEDISLPNDQFGFRVLGPSARAVFDSRVSVPTVESVHNLILYDDYTAMRVDTAVTDRGDVPWVLANNFGPVHGVYPAGDGVLSLFVGPAFRSPSNSVVSAMGYAIRGFIPTEIMVSYSNPTQLVVLRSL